MKYFINILFLFVFIQQITSAQFRIVKASGGGDFDIGELGAIVNDQNGKIKIDVLMPAENRKKEYANVDVLEGDEIIMVNGEKIKSAKDCKQIYDKLPVGDEFKMGINRDGNKFIASFRKANPKDLPKRKIVIRNDGNPDEDVFAFPALGFILTTKEKKLIVDEVLGTAESTLKIEIKRGDILTELNGDRINSGQDFSEKYDHIKVGEKMTIGFSQNGKLITASFNKPEPKGKVIIRN